MGCYVCDAHHIGALAHYVASHYERHNALRRILEDDEAPDWDLPALVAAELVRANIISVRRVYGPEGREPGLPEGMGVAEYMWLAMQAARRQYETEPVQVLKAAECYEYQCSGHPDWDGSAAREILQIIRVEATQELPGYDDAEWGWPTSDIARIAS